MEMNRCILIGRIVRDLSLHNLESGSRVINNVLAINRLTKSSGKQTADFIPFVAWGRKAELLDQYCKKGDQVALEGRLQSRSYETKDKEVRYVVELNVDNIQFLQNKKEEVDLLKELAKK